MDDQTKARAEEERRARMKRLREEPDDDETTVGGDDDATQKTPATKQRIRGSDEDDDEGSDDDNDNERMMQQLMGFSGFDSTKHTKVEDNHTTSAAGAVQKHKARKYRQYMNRKVCRQQTKEFLFFARVCCWLQAMRVVGARGNRRLIP